MRGRRRCSEHRLAAAGRDRSRDPCAAKRRVIHRPQGRPERLRSGVDVAISSGGSFKLMMTYEKRRARRGSAAAQGERRHAYFRNSPARAHDPLRGVSIEGAQRSPDRDAAITYLIARFSKSSLTTRSFEDAAARSGADARQPEAAVPSASPRRRTSTPGRLRLRDSRHTTRSCRG
jgi:hypothetical protein